MTISIIFAEMVSVTNNCKTKMKNESYSRISGKNSDRERARVTKKERERERRTLTFSISSSVVCMQSASAIKKLMVCNQDCHFGSGYHSPNREILKTD